MGAIMNITIHYRPTGHLPPTRMNLLKLIIAPVRGETNHFLS
jgi:hypothetical protein